MKNTAELEPLVLSCNKLAMDYLRKSDYPNALHTLKRAQDLLNTPCMPPNLIAITLNNLGCYYKKVGKFRLALEHLQKALELEGTSAAEKTNLAGTHLNICAILSHIGEHYPAMKHAQQALTLLDQSGDAMPSLITTKIIAQHNLAVEYEFLQKFTEALETYKAAFGLSLRALGPSHKLTESLKKSLVSLKGPRSLSNTARRQTLPKLNTSSFASSRATAEGTKPVTPKPFSRPVWSRGRTAGSYDSRSIGTPIAPRQWRDAQIQKLDMNVPKRDPLKPEKNSWKPPKVSERKSVETAYETKMPRDLQGPKLEGKPPRFTHRKLKPDTEKKGKKSGSVEAERLFVGDPNQTFKKTKHLQPLPEDKQVPSTDLEIRTQKTLEELDMLKELLAQEQLEGFVPPAPRPISKLDVIPESNQEDSKNHLILVQATTRMFLHRQHFLKTRQAAIKIQSQVRVRQCRALFVSIRMAALFIQAFWRGARVRKHLKAV